MMIGYQSITFFLALLLIEVSLMSSPDEEWVLNFDSPVYVCSDELSQELFEVNDVEVQRHNETMAFMSGSIQFLKGLEACTLVELIVEKEKNGRVELLATHDMCDLCSEMHVDSQYYRYLKYFGFPEACPFDAGAYHIHDFIVDSDDLPVSASNEGRYLVTLKFHHNPACGCKEDRIFLGCLKLDFVIEPL